MSQHRIRIDLTDAQLKNLKLEQEVTIVTKGTIVELRASSSLDTPLIPGSKSKESTKIPPEIVVDVVSTKISAGNAFAKLAEDEDEE